MDKKNILFVDDEPNILLGIKRMLRPMRDLFELSFAENGKEALEILADTNIDIIVSDMRMPVMDGAELFTKVIEQHPHAIRIMLTGQADDESVLKTVCIVHQFLTKPCAPDKLKEVLDRSSALLDLMKNEQLKDLIAGIDTLPSLPSVYAKLQEVLRDPDASMDQVAGVIEQDMAMTAKLMQLVNSSFFGLYTKVGSPARAVKLLGLETVKVLILGVQIFAEMKIEPSQVSVEYLFRHSMSVAHLSKKICLEASEDNEMINNCFLGGLLHDIGRLLLLSKMSENYDPILKSSREDGLLLVGNELSTLQATHADVGAYLIGLWGFNGDVVEAIAFHHDLDRYPATQFTAAFAVHLADFFYYEHYPEDVIGLPPSLNTDIIEKFGYTDHIEHWRAICHEFMEKNDGNG